MLLASRNRRDRPLTTDIRFGTDGWRALIAEDFTFENVARCAHGLCDHLKEAGVAEVFPPGTALATIVSFIQESAG